MKISEGTREKRKKWGKKKKKKKGKKEKRSLKKQLWTLPCDKKRGVSTNPELVIVFYIYGIYKDYMKNMNINGLVMRRYDLIIMNSKFFSPALKAFCLA